MANDFIQQFDELADVDPTDVLPISDDPSGTGRIKKVKAANLLSEARKGYESFRYAGNATHWAGAQSSYIGFTSSGALTAGTYHAVPFVSGRGHTMDAVYIALLGLGAGENTRLGLYEDNGSIYPGALVPGSEIEFPAADFTNILTLAQAITLEPDKLYWAVLQPQSAAVEYVKLPREDAYPLFGIAAPSAQPRCLYTLAGTYGALPDPFTAGATPSTSDPPAIGLRLTG